MRQVDVRSVSKTQFALIVCLESFKSAIYAHRQVRQLLSDASISDRFAAGDVQVFGAINAQLSFIATVQTRGA